MEDGGDDEALYVCMYVCMYMSMYVSAGPRTFVRMGDMFDL